VGYARRRIPDPDRLIPFQMGSGVLKIPIAAEIKPLYHSCNDSVTLKTHLTVTFHLAIRLSSISASTLVTRAVWIPMIVTLARVIAI
jgi:hypothetical protein